MFRNTVAGALAVSVALVLSFAVLSCGGGDDDPSDSQTPPLSLVEAAVQAAQNAPVQGSVTQGSDGVNGITSGSVNWDNSASEVSRGDKTATSTSSTDIISGTAVPSSLGVSHYASSDESFVAQVVSDSASAMVGGIWAVKDGDGNLSAFGAFADGAGEDATPSDAVPADGTYSGNMVAFYNDSADPDDIYSSYSQGTVTLTVSGGSVSGTVTGISNSDPETGTFGSAVTVTVTLSSASSAAFFSGDTSTPDGEGGTVAGKWGGEFYGASGGYIGGTVGMTFSGVTVIGAFLTSRN